jgi:hypothetical protein
MKPFLSEGQRSGLTFVCLILSMHVVAFGGTDDPAPSTGDLQELGAVQELDAARQHREFVAGRLRAGHDHRGRRKLPALRAFRRAPTTAVPCTGRSPSLRAPWARARQSRQSNPPEARAEVTCRRTVAQVKNQRIRIR